jgi:hypothetical protein
MTSFQDTFSKGGFAGVFFMLVMIQMYAIGAQSASDTFWVQSLGLLLALPIAVLSAAGTTNVFIMPFAGIAMLFLYWQYRNFLGEGIGLAILASAILLMLGI